MSEQRAWQNALVQQRHESTTLSFPELARWKCFAPPRAPAPQRPTTHTDSLLQLSRTPLGDPTLHRRHQQHHGTQIHPTTQETDRRWRLPAATTLQRAAKTESLVVFRAQIRRPAPRFALVVSPMNTAAAMTTVSARLLGKSFVDGEQKLVQPGILQHGEAHLRSPWSWSTKEIALSGRFCQVPRGGNFCFP